ncbi:hypothetical protein CBR_g30662 [Chara braunii]|uniref:Uncharacterized protein n=1 Tax=Chara braunii TaxID=69332 RepID=A0A388LDA9_CHABU|nr:hypothetical protein CBR_g30662 [Chara braunii]|eukprot:GBG80295.1 hypothetical protein CBR_g30662 [Chara braunii]
MQGQGLRPRESQSASSERSQSGTLRVESNRHPVNSHIPEAKVAFLEQKSRLMLKSRIPQAKDASPGKSRVPGARVASHS